MIYPLQHYTNKIVYYYLENIDITKYKNDITLKNTEYEWMYDIYLMSDMNLYIDIIATTPENRYAVRQCFTLINLTQFNIKVRDFADLIGKRLINEIEYKYNISIYDTENKKQLMEMFVNDFWNVFEREDLNYNFLD